MRVTYICDFRFLNSNRPPLIIKQRPSTESVPHAYGFDNPVFVSDLAKTMSPSHTPISNQSVYLRTPESKIYLKLPCCIIYNFILYVYLYYHILKY